MPAHLNHGISPVVKNILSPLGWVVNKIHHPFNLGFNWFRDNPFKSFVRFTFRWRYATIATALAMLIFSVGMVSSGRVPFAFFSGPEGDIVFANVSMT